MIFARSLDDLRLHAAWATVGMFDGVHLGHQAIIGDMVQQAHAVGSPAAVVTFHPSPVAVLRQIPDFQYLTLLEERAVLLSRLGVDYVVGLEFNRQLAALTAEEFIHQMVKNLGMAHLWAGHDFALGRNRQGTLPVLRELGLRHAFQVDVVAPVMKSGEIISSSRIRSLLHEGQLKQVTSFLGRWYAIEGKVVHGDGRGRTIGIPTANLLVDRQKLLPLDGVYACWIWVGPQCLPAVVNVGVRPTFDQANPVRRVEAHVLDFQTELYGQDVRLEFVSFVRPERRFDGVQALVEQVQRDIQETRDILVRLDLERGG